MGDSSSICRNLHFPLYKFDRCITCYCILQLPVAAKAQSLERCILATFPDEVIGTGIVVVACDRNRRWRQRDSAYIGFSVEQKPVLLPGNSCRSQVVTIVDGKNVVCRCNSARPEYAYLTCFFESPLFKLSVTDCVDARGVDSDFYPMTGGKAGFR